MTAKAADANMTAVAPADSAREKFYWSVRRELWENRSLYIAPLAVAAVALLAFFISTFLGIWEPALRLTADHPQMPFNLLAGLLMLTAIVVSVFYSQEALHSERRDRSILFWKSLPLSDATAVLSKASIPLLVVPLIAFAVTFTAQFMMLLWSTLIITASGQSVTALWTRLSFFQMSLLVLYHFATAHALWPMPVYSWILLVSGWARRAVLLWALLPVLVIGALEGIFYRTPNFPLLVFSRLMGDAPTIAHGSNSSFPLDPASTHIAPGMFLTSPALWLGLIFSAVCLLVAIRLRRYRGPI